MPRTLGRCVCLLSGSFIWSSTALVAQAPDCPSTTLQATAGEEYSVPASANLTNIMGKNDAVIGPLPTEPAGGKWKPVQADIEKLADAKVTDQSASIAFVKRDQPTQLLCKRTYAIPSGPTAGPPPPPPAAGKPQATGAADRIYGASDCRTAGAVWEAELRRQQTRDRFTELVLLDGGSGSATPCYYNRDYGVVGDPIYVAMFTENPQLWTEVSFDPCAAESAAPNVLQASEKFPISALQASGQYHLSPFLPRRCYNTSVDITVRGSKATAAEATRYPLKQADRYRATLQAGVLFTTQHDGDFGLRASPADPTQQVIFDKGPTDRGPEYTASLVLYAFPRYLASLVGQGERSYPGRDVLHDQSILDRLGLVLGVGLTNPSKRFVLGFSGEVLYGVNAVGVWEFARVQRLSGFAVGGAFSGTADQIPTTKVWDTDFVFGLSVDLRYVSLLFTGSR
jgi:hypothetical protein